MPFNRRLERAIVFVGVKRLQRADPGGGQIAGDTAHAETVGAVGRNAELDHRIVEAHHFGGFEPDRGVFRQVDDAFVIFGNTHLAFRQQHAVRFDTTNLRLLEIDTGTGNMGARRCEDTDHAGACIRRAADYLYLFAVTRINGTDAQTIRIRMLFGFYHFGGSETFQIGGGVGNLFDLEAKHCQPFGECVERRVCLQMFFQPFEGELHGVSPRNIVGTSIGTKP